MGGLVGRTTSLMSCGIGGRGKCRGLVGQNYQLGVFNCPPLRNDMLVHVLNCDK